jgi:hypothetical protein
VQIYVGNKRKIEINKNDNINKTQAIKFTKHFVEVLVGMDL